MTPIDFLLVIIFLLLIGADAFVVYVLREVVRMNLAVWFNKWPKGW